MLQVSQSFVESIPLLDTHVVKNMDLLFDIKVIGLVNRIEDGCTLELDIELYSKFQLVRTLV